MFSVFTQSSGLFLTILCTKSQVILPGTIIREPHFLPADCNTVNIHIRFSEFSLHATEKSSVVQLRQLVGIWQPIKGKESRHCETLMKSILINTADFTVKIFIISYKSMTNITQFYTRQNTWKEQWCDSSIYATLLLFCFACYISHSI
jgi:hypothetical protein